MFLRLDGRDAHRRVLRLERDLRQPEIEDFRLPSICHEDIRWLDVPVDDSFGMGCVERVRDLDAQIEHLFDFERLTIDLMPEGLPFQQFHGDEGSTIGLVNLMDRADVWMVQGGRGLGLPFERAESLHVIVEFVRKKLESNVATEL